MDELRLLKEVEVADLLGLNPSTLRTWRREHRGPAFIRLSPTVVRYPAKAVKEYIESCDGENRR